jgi:tetratricopeptide (TPR) repeat protein
MVDKAELRNWKRLLDEYWRLADLNKPDEALDILVEAISSSPHHFTYELINDLSPIDDKTKLQAIDRLLATEPEDEFIWWTKFGILYYSDEVNKALKVLDEAFKVAPQTIDTIQDHLWEFEEHDYTLLVINKALEIKPDNVELLQEKATQLDILERYSEAIESIDKALAVKIDDISLLQTKASYLDRAGRCDEIAKIADKALTIGLKIDENIDSVIDKANILSLAKRYNDAVRAIDEALVVKPSNIDLLKEKLKNLELAKKYAESIAVCNSILELKPEDHDMWARKISNLEKFGNDDLVAEISKTAYAIFYNKGVENFNDNNFKDAISYYHSASKIKIKDLDLAIKTGDSYFKNKNYGNAQRQYNIATKLDSNNAEAWYKEGMAFKEWGKKKDANKCIEKALSINAYFSPTFDHKMISAPEPTQSSFLNNLLEKKKQIILYGPPGTGKTYVARKSAVDFIEGIL